MKNMFGNEIKVMVSYMLMRVTKIFYVNQKLDA
jgi:hypothetical protein